MGTKSKTPTVTHYFTDKKTKQKFSNTFRSGGMFGSGMMHASDKFAVDAAVYGRSIVLQVTIDSWKKRIVYAWKTLCGEVLFSTVRVKPEEFNENTNNS